MSDQPVAPALPVGFHQHDGFYLRLAAGPSALRASWKEGAYDWSITGWGYALVLTCGVSITRNLVVYGEMTGSEVGDLTLKVNGDSKDLKDYNASLDGFGLGGAYYLMPANVYFSVTLTLSRLRAFYSGPSTGSEGSGTDINLFTDRGIGGTIMAGKEWWVTRNWGVGVAGVVYLASMKVPYYSRATAEALSLVLSATYN